MFRFMELDLSRNERGRRRKKRRARREKTGIASRYEEKTDKGARADVAGSSQKNTKKLSWHYSYIAASPRSGDQRPKSPRWGGTGTSGRHVPFEGGRNLKETRGGKSSAWEGSRGKKKEKNAIFHYRSPR